MRIVSKLSIYTYQIFLSPILRLLFGTGCRYQPTCSEYSKQAVLEYGFIKGVLLSVKRISRCHPLGGQGYDPIPSK